MMRDHFLLFVPGIMGSELWLQEESNGATRSRCVWGCDLSAMAHILAWDPLTLAHPNIVEGRVIREIRRPLLRAKPVYKGILEFLTKELGYQESENFLSYGYDWRLDVRETAAQLGRLLRAKAEEGKQEFRILAHSMGGVIVRLMLAESAFSDIAARTSLFLQIGSPVSGAPSAFYSTKQFPQIHALLTLLIQMSANMDKLVRHELLTTLASFPSLFQMMPPNENQFLVNGTDQFSTFSKGVWTNQYAAYLAGAMETHRQLRSSAFERMKIIYGYNQATHDKYAVTQNFRIHEVLEPQNGDGTVGVQSATSFASEDQILAAVEGVPHDELPNCKVVLDIIAKELAA